MKARVCKGGTEEQIVYDFLKAKLFGKATNAFFQSRNFDFVVEAVANELRETTDKFALLEQLKELETPQARDKFRLALVYKKMAHHSDSELYEKTTYNKGLATILSGIGISDKQEEE